MNLDNLNNSVEDSVWDSVLNSMRDSVWGYVLNSMRDSGEVSVRSSIYSKLYEYEFTR